MKDSAMVVFSGGQDSTTCLYWAKQHFDKVHAITINYGQRHSRELDAARHIAQMAGVESHTVIDVPGILRSTSPLTDQNAPLEKYTDFESMERTIGDRVELTFVPLRNAFFLTLAANIALSKGCRALVTGVCEQDTANYPDCRETFIDAQEDAINEALGIVDFRIHTPLIEMTKADSINYAKTVPGCMEALAYSHTCYAGEFPPCGKCHSCLLRAHGFEEAGVPDPLVVRAQTEALPCSEVRP
jgi:7-cyano-7-deazaguanine synthase